MSMARLPPDAPILIAGPTASGKSTLAMAIAREFDGIVINADSMQVYRELRILTARPSLAEERAIPHRLYGHVPGAAAYSTGHWVQDVTHTLQEAARLGKRAIVVGGTGLYFKALLEGLSPVPQVPPDVRRRWRETAAGVGPAALHATLKARDPKMARRLSPSDPQRLTRALEVLEGTGRSLAEWQAMPREPVLVPAHSVNILLLPDRAVLNQRCDERFEAMMAAGALDEVRSLKALGLPPEQPVLKALGVPPLMDHLDGRLALENAVALAKQQTRDYVKRQRTWFQRNIQSWTSITTQFYNEIEAAALSIVRGKH